MCGVTLWNRDRELKQRWRKHEKVEGGWSTQPPVACNAGWKVWQSLATTYAEMRSTLLIFWCSSCFILYYDATYTHSTLTCRFFGMSDTETETACSFRMGSSNSVTMKSPNTVPCFLSSAFTCSVSTTARRVLKNV